MSEINVISTTQKIIVDPASYSVSVIYTGPAGPTGPPAASDDTKWTRWSGTQAEYDAIVTKDPITLYVVI
jgi:hypothetical protein